MADDVSAFTEFGRWLIETFGLWGAIALILVGVISFVTWRIREDRRADKEIAELRNSYERRIAELRDDIGWYREVIEARYPQSKFPLSPASSSSVAPVEASTKEGT